MSIIESMDRCKEDELPELYKNIEDLDDNMKVMIIEKLNQIENYSINTVIFDDIKLCLEFYIFIGNDQSERVKISIIQNCYYFDLNKLYSIIGNHSDRILNEFIKRINIFTDVYYEFEDDIFEYMYKFYLNIENGINLYNENVVKCHCNINYLHKPTNEIVMKLLSENKYDNIVSLFKLISRQTYEIRYKFSQKCKPDDVVKLYELFYGPDHKILLKLFKNCKPNNDIELLYKQEYDIIMDFVKKCKPDDIVELYKILYRPDYKITLELIKKCRTDYEIKRLLTYNRIKESMYLRYYDILGVDYIHLIVEPSEGFFIEIVKKSWTNFYYIEYKYKTKSVVEEVLRQLYSNVI